MKFISQKDWGIPLMPSKVLRIEESNSVTMITLKPGTRSYCTRMTLMPTPGSLILIRTLNDQFLYGSFHRWLLVHGPVNEIILKEVQEAIMIFSTVKKLTQQEALFPITLNFFAHYNVSWILK
jgi:hypothetical protein